MILQISEDVSKIAIRTKSWRNQRYVRDWQNLYLIIDPGQAGGDCCCHEGGSPWFVWGCWPGHRTGVDLMNPPRPDFPAFVIKAEELRNDSVVFTLPTRWRETVPFGRYNGTLRYQPIDRTVPINAIAYLGQWHQPPEECFCNPPPPPVIIPHNPTCDIARFDIDYGPLCYQHFLDRVDVELEDVI